MIDPLSSAGTTLASASLGNSTKDNRFDAALQAAQKAEQRSQSLAKDMEAIKTDGFSNWVRDTQIEALKEKLRQQVMADMGVDEDSLGRLSAVMREVLEKKIQEEVDRRMQEATAANEDETSGTGTGTQSSLTSSQTGKNDQDGKTCPVIPALSWPGAASLL